MSTDPLGADAYVVMMSARADEVDRLIGFEAGADDYLTKPFSPRELHARVNAMFRRPRREVATNNEPATSPVATVAPSELTAAFDRVTLRLKHIHPHPRPHCCGRRDDMIWCDGWTEDDHLVEVHVGNLRGKLNRAATPAPRISFIRTIRGVGYRMEDPEQVALAS